MNNKMDNIALFFGQPITNGLSDFGAMSRFLFKALTAHPKISAIFNQMMVIGIRSLPVVFMATIFTGFIATWQVKYIAGDMGGMQYLGAMVLKAVLTELGPTLIGLVLAGRIGAKVAAEVGTMRVTEQIDAMICLSLDPIKYSIAPRIYAGFIITPILFIYGSLAAVFSSQLLAWLTLDVSPGVYFNSMRLLFQMSDLYMGLIKSFLFGGISALTGCYYGFFTKGGAVGVGTSTRNAVVSSSILILVANLFVSLMM
jgi:phospholipid/cholesterol/gamma-HCH transport system permease protein